MYFLAENSEFMRLVDNGVIIPVIAIVLGCSIAVVAIIAGSLRSVSIVKAQEQSRREMAAYVAEGTMAPDDAVAIMNAGKSGCNVTGIDSRNA